MDMLVWNCHRFSISRAKSNKLRRQFIMSLLGNILSEVVRNTLGTRDMFRDKNTITTLSTKPVIGLIYCARTFNFNGITSYGDRYLIVTEELDWGLWVSKGFKSVSGRVGRLASFKRWTIFSLNYTGRSGTKDLRGSMEDVLDNIWRIINTT